MTQLVTAELAGLARRHQAELDRQIADWRQGSGAGIHLWCGPGCSNCCTLTVNATLPEALAIAELLDTGQRSKLAATAVKIIAHARQCADAREFLTGYRHAVGSCPFLDASGNCRIYAARPLACRALLATRPPDWCGVNLAGLPDYERDVFLASLDRTVVAFPSHYAAEPQALATDLERGLVLAMIRSTGFGLTGNLPLLVWLCGEPEFFTSLSSGSGRLRTFLADRGADQPFLVQIDMP